MIMMECHSCDDVTLCAKAKRFYRWVPNQFDFELSKRENILGGPDLTR